MIQVFEPSAEVAAPNLGIVYLNHGGSVVAHDTGRDAASMSEAFSLPVIAADRPGSNIWVPRRIGLPGNMPLRDKLATDYVGAVSNLGEEIAKEAGVMGLDSVVIVGRSAAGMGAIVLAQTETLPAVGLYAAEPLGMRNVGTIAGRMAYKAYEKEEKSMIDSRDQYPDLVRPDPTDTRGMDWARRMATLPLYWAGDTFTSDAAWAKLYAYYGACEIAGHMTTLDVQIDFAAFSPVLGDQRPDLPPRMHDIFTLPQLRAKQPGKPAPFNVERVQNTTHKSFDKRSHLQARASGVVGRAIANAKAA